MCAWRASRALLGVRRAWKAGRRKRTSGSARARKQAAARPAPLSGGDKRRPAPRHIIGIDHRAREHAPCANAVTIPPAAAPLTPPLLPFLRQLGVCPSLPLSLSSGGAVPRVGLCLAGWLVLVCCSGRVCAAWPWLLGNFAMARWMVAGNSLTGFWAAFARCCAAPGGDAAAAAGGLRGRPSEHRQPEQPHGP